ncbi:Aspartyl protease [Flavobacterium fontis]|uniref:Aspartyl protease n=1 Tax=Flavobacterium fontis TaxID=1124188 RepID=A0A1M4Z5I7_9FLAO|nr:retropepsin-like aspartic protease [Flavobacterium fontis]SHF13218.1 Aspartyl protease [Flavobacterium fontis]
MKKWIVVCWMFLGIGYIWAQDFKLDAGKISQKEFLEEVDFELEHGKIIIPVSLAGQTYRFLLDTGAPNIISKRVANILNPASKRDVNVVDANNTTQNMEMVPLPEMRLGSLQFENGVAIVVDLDNHPVLKCYRLDGFVGSNFFKNAVLQVDYAAKKIKISHTIKSFSPQTKGFPMQLVGQQLAPYVALEHQSEGCKEGSEFALLDTGMDGFYDLSNRVYADFKKGEVVKTLGESTGVVSLGLFEKLEPSPHRLVQIQKMKINGITFSNIITETTDDDNSRMGLDVFKLGKVTLDFQKKKWYFEAPSQNDLSQKTPQFTPTLIDQKLVVGIVWDEALKAKIQFGNPIVRIDQLSLEKLSVCDIVRLKERITTQSAEIEIINNNGETVTIKK